MIEVQHDSDEEVDDDCYLSLDIVSDDCDAQIVEEDPESIITLTSRKQSLCTDIRRDISLSPMQTHNLSASMQILYVTKYEKLVQNLQAMVSPITSTKLS